MFTPSIKFSTILSHPRKFSNLVSGQIAGSNRLIGDALSQTPWQKKKKPPLSIFLTYAKTFRHHSKRKHEISQIPSSSQISSSINFELYVVKTMKPYGNTTIVSMIVQIKLLALHHLVNQVITMHLVINFIVMQKFEGLMKRFEGLIGYSQS